MFWINFNILALCNFGILYSQLYSKKNIAIIDAGSTGLRLHIYNFDQQLKEIQQFLYPEPLSINNSTFAIKSLLRNIDTSIPLGFYATAGLRNDPNKTIIMSNVIKELKKYNLKESKILTGQEEAIGLFTAFEYFWPEIQEYYLLDMGGMSTQIVSKTTNFITIDSINTGIMTKKVDNITNNLNNAKEIFVFSVLKDLLQNFNGKYIKEIQHSIKHKCSKIIQQQSLSCRDLIYISNIFNKLNISSFTKIKFINNFNNNMYVSWPIGKALNLAQSIF